MGRVDPVRNLTKPEMKRNGWPLSDTAVPFGPGADAEVIAGCRMLEADDRSSMKLRQTLIPEGKALEGRDRQAQLCRTVLRPAGLPSGVRFAVIR